MNNIARGKAFNVDGIQKHSNEFVRVASIVREMQTFEYNFFSLYKQQGEQLNGRREWIV